MSNTYLIVFHGQEVNGKIIDYGDDPCFENPPTWGICRPTTRKSIKVKDTLIFIAKVGKDYFLKGWFQVGEKIDYISALNRYPHRQNVIISSVAAHHLNKWKDKNLQKQYETIHGSTTPTFLRSLIVSEGTFYQAKRDEHETDNWKCRRILHCKRKQLEKCIGNNTCLKERQSLVKEEYKNYVVAEPEQWEDLDSLRISLEDIISYTGFSTPIMTPYHQHNVLCFNHCKETFFQLLTLRKAEIKN